MAFSVGDRLGRFEILGSLGAGGMGEVYRARDSQLKRDVAIKVLPLEFSQDADRRRRFELEARAAGGFNHPNILAVYDVGLEGDVSFIVTELLEGETLAARIDGRPLPVRRAIEYSVQIAAGLAAAHEHGVVHRDIKPANVFVTTGGLIKILDFGLAKLSGPQSSGDTETVIVDGESQAPLIGTVAYMSPEQARGRHIDHRTDIFSLGVVFYEMLSGVRPFLRGTIAETINAIQHDEPADLARSEAAIPALERIVRHCLEKKPEERFQSARDLAFDLESQLQEVGRAAQTRRHRQSRRTLLAAAGVVVVVAAAAAGALIATRGNPASIGESGLTAYRVLPLTNAVGLEEFPAISPDGKMVAFTARDGPRRQIFIRFLAGGSGSLLQVTSDEADHQLPRWSPDGTSIFYFSPASPGEVQGAIHKIPALRGASQRVIASIGGGDVSRTGRLACFRLEGERMQLVTSTLEGADIKPIAQLPTRHHGYPRWSPDGQWIAFVAGDGLRWEVYVVNVNGAAAPRQMTDDRKTIRGLTWLPDSSGVIYASSRASSFPYLPPLALWEARLDGHQRQITAAETSQEQPDLHPNGLVAISRLRTRFEIWKYAFDPDGERVSPGQQLTFQTGQVSTPTVSPAGDEVAYLSDNGGHANLWVASMNGTSRQITLEDDANVSVGLPIWSPRSPWIAFVSSKGNVGLDFGIWLVKPDGAEQHPLVAKGLGAAWSEDGAWLYYVEGVSSSIKRVAAAGGAPQTVRTERARNIIGTHGSTLYFVVDRALMDGRQQYEIRAAPLGDGPSRMLTTIEASRVPSWQVVNPSLSPDGKWLATLLTDGFTTNIWAISTDDGRRMKRVTDFGDRAVFIARRVSWSADGKSIIAAVGEGDADIVLLDGLLKNRSGK